ncbi:hypothetical protein T12_8195 [Trichinella patagoniensis]|uniref:Uncharacterized protein n=1 Tax=Trichinella patagoniensis TaxID=990121 RepID=A0A0V0ZXX2_9BILA|nr:hypothetical protein T12_8195 [Trichinella patagoniensis]
MGNKICKNRKNSQKPKVTFGKPPIVKLVPMDQLPPHPVHPTAIAERKQPCSNNRAWVVSKICKIGGYVYNSNYTRKEYIEPYSEIPSWLDAEIRLN